MSDIALELAREHMTDFQLSRTTLYRELDKALNDDAAFGPWLSAHVPEAEVPDVFHAREKFLGRAWKAINDVLPEPRVHVSAGRAFVAIYVGGVA
jgi:hypothetical protein